MGRASILGYFVAPRGQASHLCPQEGLLSQGTGKLEVTSFVPWHPPRAPRSLALRTKPAAAGVLITLLIHPGGKVPPN